MSRKFPRPIKRVVVKVGTSILATSKMKPKRAQLRQLTEQLSALNKQDIDVVVVSSGAIAFGLGEVGQRTRPTELSELQALAAIGQNVLMRTYYDLFKKKGLCCAQVLLTWDDFADRARFVSAKKTLDAILNRKAIAVINENDTISTDEIKFGDNDQLSALVASLIHADLLVILSDVEGLYDLREGGKKVFEEIKEITEEIKGIASGTSKKHVSKGGMITKLQAVKIATHAHIPCVIANGQTENILSRIVDGERVGTLFVEKENKLLSRKHWISFGAKPKGEITIDDGAKKAVLEGGRSLLLPGLINYQGHFKAEDVVIVKDKNHHEIARGIINYSIGELNKLDDKKGQRELIHRDDLVLSTEIL